MRLAVFVFSLILIFTPIHAYALLFIPAVKGAIIRTAGSQFVKVNSKRALVTAGVAYNAKIVYDYCKKTKKCDDIIENASELFGDDDDSTNQNTCISRKYTVLDGSSSPMGEFSSFGDAMSKIKEVVSENYRDVSYDTDFADQKNKEFTSSTNGVKKGSNLDYSHAPIYIKAQRKLGGVNSAFAYYIKMSYQIDCDDTDEQNYVCPVYGYMGNPTQSARYYCSNYGGGALNSKSLIKNGNTATLSVSCKSRDTNIHCTKKDVENKDKELTKEQIQKIVNNMSDDDVTYIINNYGDDIEIQKYCSENACDELSDEFGNEVNNNKDKYDIDKINKANCVVKNGKIVSCDNAKIDKADKEGDSNKEGDTDNGDNSDDSNKDDDKKINCEASEFHKKVCDFIDWYQDDFEHDNTDTGVEVDDKSDDLPKHKDHIKFNAQCPPDKIINLSFAGVNKSLKWTYKDFCHAMIELKPFVVGFSMITGAFIIAGRRV